VRSSAVDNPLLPKASARLSVAAPELNAFRAVNLSAGALTRPHSVTSGVIANAFDNSKSAEGKPSNIFNHFVTSKLTTAWSAWQAAVNQLFGGHPSQASRLCHET
jgi:hypothetical protein